MEDERREEERNLSCKFYSSPVIIDNEEEALLYSQPVMLLDGDGDQMTLEQQMFYMRERSGK